MASPFPLVQGVAIIVPATLHEGAKCMTGFNYNREDLCSVDFSIQLAATSAGPATHYGVNYGSTTPGFWWLVYSGSLIGNRPTPEWMSVEQLALATAADEASGVWDPNNLIADPPESMPMVDDFDPTKVILIPLATGKWAEARDALALNSLVRVEADEV